MESFVSPDPEERFASNISSISAIEPFVRSPLRDTTNQYINSGNINKKPEVKEPSHKTPQSSGNSTFVIQEVVENDFQSSTPKKSQDCDTESDTTADYESAGEASPWKEKSTNLSALAESLAKVHLSTPNKIHSKLNHFPYSPISAEDEDEEVISITSNSSHNTPSGSLSLLEEITSSNDRSCFDVENIPFAVINSSQVIDSSKVEGDSQMKVNTLHQELFKVIPESQISSSPNSLKPKECNEAEVISPVVEFEDAGPTCSYHSGIMNSIGSLNISDIPNNSLIEDCKHSKTCENLDNKEFGINNDPRQQEICSDLEKNESCLHDSISTSTNSLKNNVIPNDTQVTSSPNLSLVRSNSQKESLHNEIVFTPKNLAHSVFHDTLTHSNPINLETSVKNTIRNSSQIIDLVQSHSTSAPLNLTSGAILSGGPTNENHDQNNCHLNSISTCTYLEDLHNLEKYEDSSMQDPSPTNTPPVMSCIAIEAESVLRCTDPGTIDTSMISSNLKHLQDDTGLNPSTTHELCEESLNEGVSQDGKHLKSISVDQSEKSYIVEHDLDNAGLDPPLTNVASEESFIVDLQDITSVASSMVPCSGELDKKNLNSLPTGTNSENLQTEGDKQVCVDLKSIFTGPQSEGDCNIEPSQDITHLNMTLTNESVMSCNVEHQNSDHDSTSVMTDLEKSSFTEVDKNVHRKSITLDTSFEKPSNNDENITVDSNLSNKQHCGVSDSDFLESNGLLAMKGEVVNTFESENSNDDSTSDKMSVCPLKNVVVLTTSSLDNSINDVPHNHSKYPLEGDIPDTSVETKKINDDKDSKELCEKYSEVPLSNIDVEITAGPFLNDFHSNGSNVSDSVLRIAIEKHPVCFEDGLNDVDALDSPSILSDDKVEHGVISQNSLEQNGSKENCNGDLSISEMCTLIETTFNNVLNEKDSSEVIEKPPINENSPADSFIVDSSDSLKIAHTKEVASKNYDLSVSCGDAKDNATSDMTNETCLPQEYLGMSSICDDDTSAQTKPLDLEREFVNEFSSIPVKDQTGKIEASPSISDHETVSVLGIYPPKNDNEPVSNLQSLPTEETEISSTITCSDVNKIQIQLDIINTERNIKLASETDPNSELTDSSSENKPAIQSLNLIVGNAETSKDSFKCIEEQKLIGVYHSPEVPKTPNNSIASPFEDDNKNQPNVCQGELFQNGEIKTEMTLKTHPDPFSPLKDKQSNDLSALINAGADTESKNGSVSFVLSFDDCDSENKTPDLKKKPQLFEKYPTSPTCKVNKRVLEYPPTIEKVEVSLVQKSDENQDDYTKENTPRQIIDQIVAAPSVSNFNTDFCINKQLVALAQSNTSHTSAEKELVNDELQSKATVAVDHTLPENPPSPSLILDKGDRKTEQASVLSSDPPNSFARSYSPLTCAGKVMETSSSNSVKPTDASKSTVMISSYEDLLDKCSEQERLLGFDDSIKVEAEKIIKELQNSPVVSSFAFPQAPKNVTASSRSRVTLCNDEENKDSFQEAVNFDFEYLSKIQGKPGFRQRARESLFLKFDPLAAAAVTPEACTPKAKPEMILPDSSSDSTPQPMNGEDLLICITPNPAPFREEPSSSPSSNFNVTPRTRPRPSSANVTPTYKNEILSREISKLEELMIKQESAYQEQIAQCVEEIEELRRTVSKYEEQQPLDELEATIAAAKADAKSLRDEVHKLTQEKADLKRVVDEYHETCTFLIKKNDQEKIEFEEKLEAVGKDRDTFRKHLFTLEVAFNDIHQKYEKSKQVIELFKHNEEEFKKALESNKKLLEEQDEQFNKLRCQASKKIADANFEIAEMKKAHHVEMAKLEAVNKKMQMQIKTLEETLEQKNREVAELTNICDELIKASSHTSVRY